MFPVPYGWNHLQIGRNNQLYFYEKSGGEILVSNDTRILIGYS